jgi:hypothetical protein
MNMKTRVGHPGKRRLQWRRAAKTAYDRRAAGFAVHGLTTRGTGRVYVIDRSELAGLHGNARKAQYQRLHAAALKAQGLTSRGTAPIRVKRIPLMEMKWIEFRKELAA